MDNMGGLRRLFYILAQDIVDIISVGNNKVGLIFEEGKSWIEISFTQETGKLSEIEEMTDNGLLYNYEASCRIPRSGPENAEIFEDLRLRELLFLGEDNNGIYWITGWPGTYFNISLNTDIGENIQDPNFRRLRISAALSSRSLFTDDPFNSLID